MSGALNESMFDITGPDGLVRRAIVTHADHPNGTVLVWLPSGFKHRVGSHRMSVRLARRLAGLGYTSLRYDYAGVGESDGTLAGHPPGTLSARLEEGYFAREAQLAFVAARERLGARRVIAGGLCGGGITALLAAAKHPEARVDGVIAIGAPVLFTGPPATHHVPLTEVARRRMRNYAQKMISPAAWARVLRGHSDFAHIGRNVWGALNLPRRPRDASGPAHDNPHFVDAFHTLRQRRVPQLFVYGSSDNRWIDFEQTFLRDVLRGRLDGPGYAVRVLPQGSHELTFEPSKQQAVDAIEAWLLAEQPHAGTPSSDKA